MTTHDGAITRAQRFLRAPPLGFKVGILLVATVCYGASGYILFERGGKPELSWDDGFWWAVVTMTTVGYGDFFPVTGFGRFLIAYPIMLIGMGFMAFALTHLVGFFVRAESLNRRGLTMTHKTGHIVVCHYPGLDRFTKLLEELRAKGAVGSIPVVVIDDDLEELSEELRDNGVSFCRGNPTRGDTLERAGLSTASRAIVLSPDARDPQSDGQVVATCLTLKSLRPELPVVAECVDADNREVLSRAGADSILCIADLTPGILAQEVADPGVVQVLQELMTWYEDLNNIYVVSLQLPAAGTTVGKLRQWTDAQGATLLGIRTSERVELNPSVERALVAGESAVIMSRERPGVAKL